MKRRLINLALAGLAAMLGASPEPADAREARPFQLQPLVVAMHVHSTFSTGALTVEQLAMEAERLGLDAVVLTDNLVLQYEYGFVPLRGVVRAVVSLPSVLSAGAQAFLAEVADVQRRHPRVLLIPGVEVAPHYYWTGSVFDRTLTMHNSQRNLLVVGLSNPDDYDALPVNGNTATYRFGWESTANLVPGLLFLPAAWLWRLRTYRSAHVGPLFYRATKRYRLAATCVGGLAAGLLVNAWPFAQPLYSPYDGTLDYRPDQAVIDAAAARGGLILWSMPEARDHSVHTFGPVGPVTVETRPYPEALVLTSGYTGFGGVYEDNRTITRPGAIWDQVLGQYLAGQRPTVPVMAGEIAFHGPGQDTKTLDRVVTVAWSRERTPVGVLEAIRSGRVYAVQRAKPDYRLRLDNFRVECEDGTVDAGSGETVPWPGCALLVRLRVSATDEGSHPVTVTLIRSGRVLARATGQTPLEHVVLEPAGSIGEPLFYRLEAKGEGGGELLSNPIFVRPARGAT
jgi:hypothetical protein